jgi:hypothetical protein
MASFSGGPKVGHKMKLYRNTGTVASPTWGEISEIGDVKLNGLELTTAELKRRANNFTKELPALFGAFTIDARLIHGLGSTIFDAVRADFFAQTSREYAVCNGDITEDGTQGLRFAGFMKAFPWDQNLEDVSGHDIVIAHTYKEDSGTEIDPSWMEVSSV